MKKVIISLLVLPMSLGLQGCTDEEVAASAIVIGAVAIGAGVAAGGGSSGSCEGSYVERCSDWRDRRFGNNHRDCRREYDPCARRGHNRPHSFGMAAVSSLSFISDAQETSTPEQSRSLQAANLASKYHMSFQSAEKILDVLDAVKNGDLSKIQNIGLTREGIETLGHGWKLSSSTVDRISQALDMAYADAEIMVNAIHDLTKSPLERQHDEQAIP